jgi:toxin YoeB
MPKVSLTEAQSKLSELIDSAYQSQEPIVISGQNQDGVLISEDVWRGIQETIYLLSIPKMGESIREGLSTSLSNCSGIRLVKWRLVYTKQAQKDAKKVFSSNLKSKILDLLEVVENNPFQNPPPYEKLVGDLDGAYSRRINIQHRLVYEVIEEEQIIKIIRMWTHYE